MNLLNKHIKLNQIFNSSGLLLVFCVLFSTASFFLGSNNFNLEKQQDSFGLTVNKSHTHYDLGTTRPTNPLSAFDFIEESETTDDSDEDDLGSLERALQVTAEAQPSFHDIALDQLGQAGLEERKLEVAKAFDLLGIGVDTDHMIAEVGEASAGHEADVAGPYYSDRVQKRALSRTRGETPAARGGSSLMRENGRVRVEARP